MHEKNDSAREAVGRKMRSFRPHVIYDDHNNQLSDDNNDGPNEQILPSGKSVPIPRWHWLLAKKPAVLGSHLTNLGIRPPDARYAFIQGEVDPDEASDIIWRYNVPDAPKKAASWLGMLKWSLEKWGNDQNKFWYYDNEWRTNVWADVSEHETDTAVLRLDGRDIILHEARAVVKLGPFHDEDLEFMFYYTDDAILCNQPRYLEFSGASIANQIMEGKPDIARLLLHKFLDDFDPKQEKMTEFDELDGLDDAKTVLRDRLVEPLKRAIRDRTAMAPQAILLTGPSDSGKTCLLEAVYNELREDVFVRYINLAYSWNNFNTEMLDLLAKEMEERTDRPMVLLYDDIDFIGYEPKSKATTTPAALRSFIERALDHGIHIVAATNKPERLDPALVDERGFSAILIEIKI